MDKQNHYVRHERASRWAWWFFAVIALFYLISEHRVHLFGILPYLLLLACPLMHFFMHGKHGERSRHDNHYRASDRTDQP